MARVYISIGSNIEAEENIRFAISALKHHFGDLILSSVYESEAVGFDGDNFLNLVAAFDTDEDIFTLAQTLRNIEDNQGRNRSGPRFSARTVDLDLLLYDDVILHDAKLDIPRDEILTNAFVLWPLAEIAPQIIHPEKKQTMSALWEGFDKASQRLWPVDFKS